MPQGSVPPTRKGLEPDDAAPFERNHRLVVRLDNVRHDRATKLPLDPDAPLDTRVHLRFKKTNTRPAIGFCATKRAICAPDQFVPGDAVTRSDGDADPNTKLG